jgi:hypothetical protein
VFRPCADVPDRANAVGEAGAEALTFDFEDLLT